MSDQTILYKMSQKFLISYLNQNSFGKNLNPHIRASFGTFTSIQFGQLFEAQWVFVEYLEIDKPTFSTISHYKGSSKTHFALHN